MKEVIKIIITFCIGGLLVYLVMLRFGKSVDPEIIIKKIPIPEPYEVAAPIPDPIKIDTPSIWEMALATIDTNYIKSLVYIDTARIIEKALSEIDTAAILADYFLIKTFTQIITDDTLFSLELSQKISMNRIIEQPPPIFSLLKNEVKIIPVKSKYIYAGAIANISSKPGFAPGINYTNDKYLFGGGYDIVNRALLFDFKLKIFQWH